MAEQMIRDDSISDRNGHKSNVADYKLIKIKVLNGQKEEPCNEVPNEASTKSVCHQTTEPSHQEGPPKSSEANTVCPETVHGPHQEAVAEPS